MSTCALTYPATRHVQPKLAIGLITLMVIISVVLMIVATLLMAALTHQHGIQADPIFVVQNPISPMPVPTVPLIPDSSADRLYVPTVTIEPAVKALPVPTPPI